MYCVLFLWFTSIMLIACMPRCARRESIELNFCMFKLKHFYYYCDNDVHLPYWCTSLLLPRQYIFLAIFVFFFLFWTEESCSLCGIQFFNAEPCKMCTVKRFKITVNYILLEQVYAQSYNYILSFWRNGRFFLFFAFYCFFSTFCAFLSNFYSQSTITL